MEPFGGFSTGIALSVEEVSQREVALAWNFLAAIVFEGGGRDIWVSDVLYSQNYLVSLGVAESHCSSLDGGSLVGAEYSEVLF